VSELGGGGRDVLVEKHGPAQSWRMPERYLWMRQAQPFALEAERSEGWRGEGERVRRRADVVVEAGECELFGSRAAAVPIGGFQDQHSPPVLGQCDGRHKPVGS
jgi:hypothetical protein